MQEQMTMNEIRKLGMEALQERLGAVGTIKFMSQFDSGYGDYTKEREKSLEDINSKSIKEIAGEIKKFEKDKGLI